MVLRQEQGLPHGTWIAAVGALLALRVSVAVGIALLSGCAVPPSAPRARESVDPIASAARAPDIDAAAEAIEIADASVDAIADVDAGDAGIEPASPRADRVLFAEETERAAAVRGCEGAAESALIRCLLDARYRDDRSAGEVAVEMFSRWKSLAGVLPEEDMDGGYRGMLHLVPVVPEGVERHHLQWVRAALADYETFFARLGEGHDGHVKYRAREIAFRFFRSVHAHTPAAFAIDWTVAYNVAGSLNVSATSVRETLFHEIFHLNDQDHGDWSPGALHEVFDAVVERCGTKIECLRPFAPSDTIVRGGTYYAFQPGNGVREYAAELAIRYYREQRAALGMEAFGRKPFKCGSEWNARAWSVFVNEFFDGIDRSPACR